MQASARFFLCAACRIPVLVCSGCDRGQIYCAGGCSQRRRRQSQREAGRRYQSSRRGRLAHAERSRRYRARHKIVTHQGCLLALADVVLDIDSAQQQALSCEPKPKAGHCHFCAAACSQRLRHGFLRQGRVARCFLATNFRGIAHEHLR